MFSQCHNCLCQICAELFCYILKWYFPLTHVSKIDINTLIKPFSQIIKNQLIILFNSNVLVEFNFFMILIICFFVTIFEQCIDNKYIALKMSLRSVKNDVGKNLLIINRILFSTNVVNFLSTSLCAFLININIFNNSLKRWFLILIYLIKRQNIFFRDICINCFANFQNLCFVYDFLFVIICMKMSLLVFFILWINKYLTQFFLFF